MTVISAVVFGTGWRPGLPGGAELLRECAARGWTVVLTGPGVAGAPALAVAEPGDEPVRAALALVDGAPSHAVAVAGSVREVLAARRAGVPCVALEAGGEAGPELRAAGAAEVHHDAVALLRVLDDSLLARPRAFGPEGAATGAARNG
ncbi:HAD family hydrolase [Streptomyces sp. NRRL WC-3742]|uniref:HAD family hydrolase n=1 Tax=Streptomyces sp. NRRL WC-3742 TaxID=1463934 RepID=UPI00068C9B0A|nr:HAD family hydrolase [Streptomyces sp. NRRL WC-3742]